MYANNSILDPHFPYKKQSLFKCTCVWYKRACGKLFRRIIKVYSKADDRFVSVLYGSPKCCIVVVVANRNIPYHILYIKYLSAVFRNVWTVVTKLFFFKVLNSRWPNKKKQLYMHVYVEDDKICWDKELLHFPLT